MKNSYEDSMDIDGMLTAVFNPSEGGLQLIGITMMINTGKPQNTEIILRRNQNDQY